MAAIISPSPTRLTQPWRPAKPAGASPNRATAMNASPTRSTVTWFGEMDILRLLFDIAAHLSAQRRKGQGHVVGQPQTLTASLSEPPGSEPVTGDEEPEEHAPHTLYGACASPALGSIWQDFPALSRQPSHGVLRNDPAWGLGMGK